MHSVERNNNREQRNETMTVTILTVSKTEVRVTDDSFGYKEFTGANASEQADKFVAFRYGASVRVLRKTAKEMLAADGYTV